jgi:hypothetical protein
MGLLDKLLGRDTKPAAEAKAEAPAAASPAGDDALAQREDETSPHHHAETEADAS